MVTRVLMGVVVAAFALVIAACSEAPAPAPRTTTPPPAAAPAPASAPRVFFVQPKNGDTIKTMSKFEFGNDRVTISAVPPGELKPEQVRPGMTHYHLGVDTECLPAGAPIPKADPWIHFGSGASEIEMQLKPGTHKLVLQSGDDLHRTITGLCEVISVTVVE